MIKKEASYRAGIGALIFDNAYNFLIVKLQGETRDRWDFVKGGAYFDETGEKTIKREIKEELGDEIEVEIIKKSSWYFMYEWPLELQQTKGFKGQVRQNYWVKYIKGNINLNKNELSKYKWVKESEIIDYLEKGGFPEYEIKRFLEDFKKLNR